RHPAIGRAGRQCGQEGRLLPQQPARLGRTLRSGGPAKAESAESETGGSESVEARPSGVRRPARRHQEAGGRLPGKVEGQILRRARAVLRDESLIPFHVAIDIGYGEQASLADIILPDATSLERWHHHSNNSYSLVPYTGLRQPLVEPLGEARSLQRILHDLAHAIGGGIEAYFAFDDMEDFYREWYSALPISWEEFKRRGIWYDPKRKPDYQLYERALTAEELAGADIDKAKGQVFKTIKGKRQCIGRVGTDGTPRRGFPTPSRLIEVKDDIFREAAKAVGISETDPLADPLPAWFPIPGHEALPDDRFVFTTFKWNVHAQGRTGHLKYEAEIVHTNPFWLSPVVQSVAKKHASKRPRVLAPACPKAWPMRTSKNACGGPSRKAASAGACTSTMPCRSIRPRSSAARIGTTTSARSPGSEVGPTEEPMNLRLARARLIEVCSRLLLVELDDATREAPRHPGLLGPLEALEPGLGSWLGDEPWTADRSDDVDANFCALFLLGKHTSPCASAWIGDEPARVGAAFEERVGDRCDALHLTLTLNPVRPPCRWLPFRLPDGSSTCHLLDCHAWS
ncbi:MAG: hypothetical protein ACI9OJ_006049, partial [Myxococcota bacterium]